MTEKREDKVYMQVAVDILNSRIRAYSNKQHRLKMYNIAKAAGLCPSAGHYRTS